MQQFCFNETIRRLDGNQLKLIAVIAMLIDHTAYLLLGCGWIPELMAMQEYYQGWYRIYRLMRTVGRIAFPIYAFLLVEGFFHTQDWCKYARNLGIFALLSELPFNLMASQKTFDPEVQNVFFTLLIGLLMLKLLDWAEKKYGPWQGHLVQLFLIGAAGWIAWILKTDYDFTGIFLIAIFYLFRYEQWKACILGIFWMTYMLGHLYYLPGYLVSFGLIRMYNGKRGRKGWKYGFYLVYPVHMLILYLIYTRIFVV